jgi:hypothetical protein
MEAAQTIGKVVYEEMTKQQQAAGAEADAGGGAGPGPASGGEGEKKDEDVIDAEYEVKDSK